MKKIILISGKQGSGKSSLSRAIIQHFKESRDYILAMPVRFAAPLYEMHDSIGEVARKYGIPFAEKEGLLLQLLGTEWARHCKGVNVWVDALKEHIKVLEMRERLAADFSQMIFVIDDCRFKNEFYGFKDISFTIRLHANEEDRKVRTHAWRDTVNHPSEIDLDDVEPTEWNLVINTSLTTKDQTFNIAINKYLELGEK